MQKIIVDEKEIEIVRTFHKDPGAPVLCEFPDGSFRYTNGDPAKTEEEVDFLPTNHKVRAIRWVRKNYGENKDANNEKEIPKLDSSESKKDEELFNMSIEKLQAITGRSDIKDREELITLAMAG